jgi:hypothetical protein
MPQWEAFFHYSKPADEKTTAEAVVFSQQQIPDAKDRNPWLLVGNG